MSIKGISSGQIPPKNMRNTIRKKIIERLFNIEFQCLPTLLEEFRFRVFTEEMASHQKRTRKMSRSYRNSFNRTVRNFCSNVTTHQIRDSVNSLPAGLLARAAIYRLKEKGKLEYIPPGQILRFYFFHEKLKAWSGSRRTRIWLVTCLVTRVSKKATKERVNFKAYVSFPYTRKLVFIGVAAPTRVMMREMADVPWDIRLIIKRKREICIGAEEKLGPIDMKTERKLCSRIELPEGITIDRREKKRLIVKQEEPF